MRTALEIIGFILTVALTSAFWIWMARNNERSLWQEGKLPKLGKNKQVINKRKLSRLAGKVGKILKDRERIWEK